MCRRPLSEENSRIVEGRRVDEWLRLSKGLNLAGFQILLFAHQYGERLLFPGQQVG